MYGRVSRIIAGWKWSTDKGERRTRNGEYGAGDGEGERERERERERVYGGNPSGNYYLTWWTKETKQLREM